MTTRLSILLALLFSALASIARASADAPDDLLRRAEAHFRAGEIKEALGDWDECVRLQPRRAAYLWQRGIALYYAGRFKEGREQFELHKSVNPDDVENAAWHYLCHAREAGVEKARAGLMKIDVKQDTRVPMAEVYELYAGKAKPEDVIAAAKKGEPKPEQLERRLFYAHLYIGLWYDAAGEAEKAKEHLTIAVKGHPVEDYMCDVGRVHLKLAEKTR